MWLTSFQTIFLATFQIMLMGLVGFVLVRKKIVDGHILDMLANLLVKFFLPCFIFMQFVQHFSFEEFPNWWAPPLIGAIIILIGLGVGYVVCRLAKIDARQDDFMLSVGFQNSGFIPLLIVTALFVGEMRQMLYVCLFLYGMAFDTLIWSVGVWLLTRKNQAQVDLRRILNPPFLTTAVSLMMAFWGINRLIPTVILDPVKMFGDCTLPMAMIVVGGNLARTPLRVTHKKELGLVILTKLIIIPAMALGILMNVKLSYMLGMLVVLETTTPSAVSFSFMSRYFKVDDQFINQAIFYSHLFSMITIPVILSVYESWLVN